MGKRKEKLVVDKTVGDDWEAGRGVGRAAQRRERNPLVSIVWRGPLTSSCGNNSSRPLKRITVIFYSIVYCPVSSPTSTRFFCFHHDTHVHTRRHTYTQVHTTKNQMCWFNSVVSIIFTQKEKPLFVRQIRNENKRWEKRIVSFEQHFLVPVLSLSLLSIERKWERERKCHRNTTLQLMPLI